MTKISMGLVRVYYGFPRGSIDYLVDLEHQAQKEGRGCLWNK